MTYDTQIQLIKSRIDKNIGRKTYIEEEIVKNSTELKVLKSLVDRQEDARLILQTIAQKTQENLVYKISDIVELCLNSVFDSNYKFVLNFVKKRNKTEAEMYLEDKDGQYDILNSCGGGISDVVTFALRIVLWNLQRPKTSNVMILDEPFKFLSKDLQRKASLLVKNISDKLGVQFIIVSHQNDIIEYADKIFKVNKTDNTSEVSD